jgi:hypothetical protein
MRYEKKIGKKVWLLDGSLDRGFHLGSKKTFTLVEWKSGKEVRDWANHFVIRDDENGNTIEVKEYQVVFALEGDNLPDIQTYLSDNECYTDEVYNDHNEDLCVSISWGDWKHEHLWCRDLMGYIGYREIGEVDLEEDGSDCYSSTHIFAKAA